MVEILEKISIRNARFAKQGLADLISYIGDCSNMIMVEIGSYVGDSTEIFAKNFKIVTAIDPWLNGYDDNDAASYQHSMTDIEAQFDELVKEYSNINKIKLKSEKAVNFFADGSIDFLYIDGLHTYPGTSQDMKLWLPKIKKTGYIGGHDYQGKFPGTIKAVDEFRKPDRIFRDTSWILKL